jgi:hypothetical protein
LDYLIEGYPSAPRIHSDAPNDVNLLTMVLRRLMIEFDDIDFNADFLTGDADS